MLQPKQIKNDKTYMTIKGLVEGEYVKSKEYKFLIRILKHIKAYNVFTKNLPGNFLFNNSAINNEKNVIRGTSISIFPTDDVSTCLNVP